MENDFLIKIDALEDQIHQLLMEVDWKDEIIWQCGINPNEDTWSLNSHHNARKYTPKKGSEYDPSYTRPDSRTDFRPRSKSAAWVSNLPDIVKRSKDWLNN